MRKFIAVLLSLLSLILFGCSAHSADIQNIKWNMSTVQDSDASTVLYCSRDIAASFPEAKVVSAKAVFSKDSFQITFSEENTGYSGSYAPSPKTSPALKLYELHFEDGSTALASFGSTEYRDGTKTPTLIISGERYTAYFYPSKEER